MTPVEKPQAAEIKLDQIYIQISEGSLGRFIRKWQSESFAGGVKYVPASAPQPDSTEVAQLVAALEACRAKLTEGVTRKADGRIEYHNQALIDRLDSALQNYRAREGNKGIEDASNALNSEGIPLIDTTSFTTTSADTTTTGEKHDQ